ncbi:MAG: HEAT repeat domain-containing protein [Gammaproteobacteria bacterium]|nr:HEAT repeat domain-containing protein [Gammaproteobacteria bacterium]
MGDFKYQHLIEIFIFLEFFIVLFFVILAYFLYLYIRIKQKLDTKRSHEIDALFLQMDIKGELMQLPYKKHVHLLIETFMAWDKAHKDSQNWQRYHVELMKEQILPAASHYIKSRNWTKRFWLLECLDYYMDQNYETILIKLINDPFSIISIGSTHIAIRFGSRRVLQSLLDKICLEEGHFQVLYISQLTSTPILYTLIEEKLIMSQEAHARESCYRILAEIGAKREFYNFAVNDVDSTNLELKLAAIRLLSDTNPEAATPILIALLKHPNWLVRNAAIRGMAHLKNNAIIPYVIEACNDSTWWVRVNAAKILAQFESPDQNDALTQELAAFQEPQYFLKIREIKKHK